MCAHMPVFAVAYTSFNMYKTDTLDRKTELQIPWKKAEEDMKVQKTNQR